MTFGDIPANDSTAAARAALGLGSWATKSSGLPSDVGIVSARKTADEGRLINTILADADLVLALAANTNYELDGWIWCDGSQTGDITIRMDVPTGATGGWNAIGPAGSSSSTSADSVLFLSVAFGANLGSFGMLAVGTKVGIHIRGTIAVSTTPGNLTFKWGQGTTDGSNATTVYTGSWLRATPIA